MSREASVIIGDLLRPVQSVLGHEALVKQVTQLMGSDISDDALQMPLLELLGFEVLETEIIPCLLSLRQDLRQAIKSGLQQAVPAAQAENKPTRDVSYLRGPGDEDVIQIDPEDPFNLRRPAVQTPGPLFDYCYISPPDMSVRSERLKKDLVPVSRLPEHFRHVFSEFQFFNPMQSRAFDAAFYGSQNLLINAPTSAGKTNVALLCVLRMVQQWLDAEGMGREYGEFVRENSSRQLKKQTQFFFSDAAASEEKPTPCCQAPLQVAKKKLNYLCVYLTPLKALATEITGKFKLALTSLGLSVLECTGDESPPQQLVDEANVLILTPEKYDVMTRHMNSESPLYLRQQLLILDEVHLLGVPQRGPVLETIVCRVKMAVEQLQTPVRIVGISATIPNYRDVQQFLGVPENGLFVFGEEYRPVPMAVSVFGAKELRQKDLENSAVLKRTEMPVDCQIKLQTDPIFADITDQAAEAESVLLGSTAFKNNKPKTEDIRDKGERERREKRVEKRLSQDEILDTIAVQMCLHNYTRQHPTLLFVHSKRQTVELAKQIAALVPKLEYGNQKAVQQAGSYDAGQLAFCIQNGVGYHNAGVDKKYRQLVENLFRQGELLVVVCTATLAWGVNLPSQTVIIRGTDVYTDRGRQDLDILEVKQIFGRAGRPQFTSKGEVGRGIILTSGDKLGQYMRLLNNETAIDSHMGEALPDVLNSEIVLGNIATVQNAFDYTRRTFYHIRIANTAEMVVWALAKLQVAKLIHADKSVSKDPNLGLLPTELGQICSFYYINYNTLENFLTCLKDSPIGNALAHEDLLHFVCSVPQFSSITPRSEETEELMKMTGQGMQQVDDIVQKALQQGRGKAKNLNKLIANSIDISGAVCKLPVRGRDCEASYKVNALVQAFITRHRCKHNFLIQDGNTVVQQLPRIVRALYEALVSFGRGYEALKMADLLESILYQTWYDQMTPLHGFVTVPVGQSRDVHGGGFTVQLFAQDRTCDIIQKPTISKLNQHFGILDYQQMQELSWESLVASLGRATAEQVTKAIACVPHLDFDVFVTPLSRKVIRVRMSAVPAFKFMKRYHGYEQEFQVLFLRQDNGLVLHSEKITVTAETQRQSIEVVALLKAGQWNKIRVGQQVAKNATTLETLELQGDEAPQNLDADDLNLKVVVRPLGWPCAEMSKTADLKQVAIQEPDPLQFNQQLNRPETAFSSPKMPYFTPLPRLQPLSTKALHWTEAEQIFKFKFFNPLQSAMFHYLYYSHENVFIGAPTSCGKTAAAEIAILQQFKQNKYRKVVYVAPLKALVRERFDDWSVRFGKLGIKTTELTGETLPTPETLIQSQLFIATPEKLDAVTRSLKEGGFLSTLSLIVLDEIQLLGTQRGFVIEALVARFKEKSPETRLVAMSTASANIRDVLQFLGVRPEFAFNFDAAARPVRLETHVQGFPGRGYCQKMDLMNRPVYAAIKKHSPNLPVLVFVSSRRQTRKTGFALLNMAQQDASAPGCFLRDPNEELAQDITDPEAQQLLRYGIGIHNAAMDQHDRNLIQTLFADGKIQLLISTSTLAWGINVPAYMTIIKGCEYYDKAQDKYVNYDISEVNQMVGRAGRPQFIQQRYRMWIREFFGPEVQKRLEERGAFEGMYHFDAAALSKHFSNPDNPEVKELLLQLEERDKTTAQAVSVIMCTQDMKLFYKQFLSEPLPFESSLFNATFGNALSCALLRVKDLETSRFPDVVNAEIAAATLEEVGSLSLIKLRNWLQKTFFFLRARRNPQLYGIDLLDVTAQLETLADYSVELQAEFSMYSNGLSIQGQPRAILLDFFTVLRVYDILDQQIQTLVDKKLVEITNPEAPRLKWSFRATQAGLTTSQYQLSYQTLDYFNSAYFEALTVQTQQNDTAFMRALAASPDYRELPVRQTEDGEMYALTASMGLQRLPECKAVEDFGSVAAKAYFLLQVQLSKGTARVVPAPNPDYLLDLATLLENSIRHSSAILDYLCAAPGKELSRAGGITKALQQLIQGSPAVGELQKRRQLLSQLKKKQKINANQAVIRARIYARLTLCGQIEEAKSKAPATIELQLELENANTAYTQTAPLLLPNYSKKKSQTYYVFFAARGRILRGEKILHFKGKQAMQVSFPASFGDITVLVTPDHCFYNDISAQIGIAGLQGDQWILAHDDFEE